MWKTSYISIAAPVSTRALLVDTTKEIFASLLKAEPKRKDKNLEVKTIFLCSLQTVASVGFEPEYGLSGANLSVSLWQQSGKLVGERQEREGVCFGTEERTRELGKRQQYLRHPPVGPVSRQWWTTGVGLPFQWENH